MPAVRRAVIDIGTNSVKLLVADVHNLIVEPVLEQSEQTRLGQGFYTTHRLQSLAIQTTAQAVANFARIAAAHGASTTRVIATSAARDATNQSELLEAVFDASRLTVEILSGEQEAEWVFRGVTSQPQLDAERLLILDVGGGGTEFILGDHHHRSFSESFRLGSVRLLERFPHSDPPTPDELRQSRDWTDNFLEAHVCPRIRPFLQKGAPPKLVGSGGAATILARIHRSLDDFDRAKIESVLIPRPDLIRHTENLWSLPLAERKRVVGLPPKRADVILTGATIYQAVMQAFDFDTLRVTTRGLRFAALTEPPPPAAPGHYAPRQAAS